MQEEEKSMKVKKGSLVIAVGLVGEEERRFVIPISYLYHPLFKTLLDSAQEVYGFRSVGPLRLPCSVDEFLHLQRLIKRELGHHHLQHQSSFSLHPCIK